MQLICNLHLGSQKDKNSMKIHLSTFMLSGKLSFKSTTIKVQYGIENTTIKSTMT